MSGFQLLSVLLTYRPSIILAKKSGKSDWNPSINVSTVDNPVYIMITVAAPISLLFSITYWDASANDVLENNWTDNWYGVILSSIYIVMQYI